MNPTIQVSEANHLWLFIFLYELILSATLSKYIQNLKVSYTFTVTTLAETIIIPHLDY